MDPSLEWPVGNPARERIFRLHEVSEELAGILSIDARHVPLPPPHDRYGDAREHNAKGSEEQQEIHQLQPHQDRPL